LVFHGRVCNTGKTSLISYEEIYQFNLRLCERDLSYFSVTRTHGILYISIKFQSLLYYIWRHVHRLWMLWVMFVITVLNVQKSSHNLTVHCLPSIVENLDVAIIFTGAVQEIERKAHRINFASFHIIGIYLNRNLWMSHNMRAPKIVFLKYRCNSSEFSSSSVWLYNQ
jgi:hypothetical protein